jgi:hypothetical protein
LGHGDSAGRLLGSRALWILHDALPRFHPLPAAVLLLGLGLASSPAKWIGVGALAIMALAPWQPFDHRPSYPDVPPLRDFMRAMARDFRPGDRLVVDPLLSAQVNSPEWIYYKSLYFEQGDFHLMESDESPARRVWYLYRQGSEDTVTSVSVRDGRVQRTSWGPWYLHAALFEAPPSDLGSAFGYALRFLGADVDRLPDVHAGDALPIRLWWAADHAASTDFPLTLELSASNGAVVARFSDPERAPDAVPLPDRINPGEILLDPRQIQIPYHLNDGMYTLQLVLPQPGANAGSSPSPSSEDDRTLVIDRFHLVSFAIW